MRHAPPLPHLRRAAVVDKAGWPGVPGQHRTEGWVQGSGDRRGQRRAIPPLGSQFPADREHQGRTVELALRSKFTCILLITLGSCFLAIQHSELGIGRVWTGLGPTLSLFTFMHWRRKWQPTPVFLPGESQGRRRLVGCRLWGRTESDTTMDF